MSVKTKSITITDEMKQAAKDANKAEDEAILTGEVTDLHAEIAEDKTTDETSEDKRIRHAVKLPIHIHFLMLDEGLYLISIHKAATVTKAFMLGCLSNKVNDVSDNQAWRTMAKKAVNNQSVCVMGLTEEMYGIIDADKDYSSLINIVRLSIDCGEKKTIAIE